MLFFIGLLASCTMIYGMNIYNPIMENITLEYLLKNNSDNVIFEKRNIEEQLIFDVIEIKCDTCKKLAQTSQVKARPYRISSKG